MFSKITCQSWTQLKIPNKQIGRMKPSDADKLPFSRMGLSVFGTHTHRDTHREPCFLLSFSHCISIILFDWSSWFLPGIVQILGHGFCCYICCLDRWEREATLHINPWQYFHPPPKGFLLTGLFPWVQNIPGQIFKGIDDFPLPVIRSDWFLLSRMLWRWQTGRWELAH